MRARDLLRVGLAVFLTTLLVGLGGSAAVALWSQSATASFQVRTGAWGTKPQPGWPMPLRSFTFTSGNGSGPKLFHGNFTWQPGAGTPTGVTYTVVLDRPVNVTGVTPASPVTLAPGAALSVPVAFERVDNSVRAELRLTITPSLDGIPAKPTSILLDVPVGKVVRAVEIAGP
jgi:hypothetical protein